MGKTGRVSEVTDLPDSFGLVSLASNGQWAACDWLRLEGDGKTTENLGCQRLDAERPHNHPAHPAPITPRPPTRPWAEDVVCALGAGRSPHGVHNHPLGIRLFARPDGCATCDGPKLRFKRLQPGSYGAGLRMSGVSTGGVW